MILLFREKYKYTSGKPQFGNAKRLALGAWPTPSSILSYPRIKAMQNLSKFKLNF
jgi:hypothetical protein